MSVRARQMLFMRFGQWGYDERGWAPMTRERYIWAVGHADRWLTQHRNTSVVWAKTPDLKAYLFSLSPNARTRNHRRQSLVAFGAFLMDTDHNEENHALSLPRLPEGRRLPKALDPAQSRALRKASRSFDLKTEVLIAILLYLGLRRTAACSAEWTNFEANLTWFRYIAKGGDEKMLPVNPRLIVLLRKWRAECPDARWVFPSSHRLGNHLSPAWVEWRVRQVGDEAGIIGLHPHRCRHTAASMLLELGADIREVQEFLGHRSLASTQIYTRVRPVRLQNVVGKLDYGEDKP